MMNSGCRPKSDSATSVSRDSRSIARRVRHQASVARQETRRELIKARSRRSYIPDRGDGPSSKDVLSLVKKYSLLSPSSPIWHGLSYIYNNFLPTFFSPRKPKKTERSYTYSAAYSVREDPLPDEDLAPSYMPRFSDILSEADFGSQSDNFSMSDDSLSHRDSATPFEDLRRYEQEMLRNGHGQHHNGCMLGLRVNEKCATCVANVLRFMEWINGIGRDGALLYEADVQIMRGELQREMMKEENNFDLQIRAWVDQMEEEEAQRLAREHRGEAPETRANHTRFHPYSTWRRVHDNRTVKLDPLVTIYADYEHQWMLIRQYAFPTFTFETIPWPLLSPPRSLEDVTVARVHDFIRFAKSAPDFGYKYSESHSSKALRELRKWDHDEFAELVLERIIDEEEAEVVRSAANVVEEALKELVMYH